MEMSRTTTVLFLATHVSSAGKILSLALYIILLHRVSKTHNIQRKVLMVYGLKNMDLSFE